MDYREREIHKLEAAKQTRHHIIAKSERELFDVFNPINVTNIRYDTHQSLHKLFRDKNGPIGEPKLQLQKFFEILYPVLSEEAIQKVVELINLSDDRFYKKELVKGQHS